MQTGTLHAEQFAHPMDPRQTARILELAVRSHARIELELDQPDEGRRLAGPIVSQAPESLCIALDEHTGPIPVEVTSVCCSAWLHVGSDRYLFATNIMAVIDTDTPPRLEIARPDVLHNTERRKFHRTRPHPSSSVRLHRPYDGFEADGALLNAAVGGISCRIATQDADRTEVGDSIRTSFQLGGQGRWFELTAVVRNKTPAQSVHQTILGLEFVYHRDDNEQRSRLADALGFGSTMQARSHDHE